MRIISYFMVLLPVLVLSLDVQYKELPIKNSFVLVVDKSGSMSGSTIEAAKLGAIKFTQQVNKQDEIGLITFNNGVDILFPPTSNRNSIADGISDIIVSGGTHLYDAIASGIKQLNGSSGRKILIYLTDGKDTGSNFSAQNLEAMCVGENILVYGIGIGDVDVSTLKNISGATKGGYYTISTSDVNKLKSIYSDVLKSYYTDRTNLLTGELVINSSPNKQIVRINNKNVGVTPIKLTELSPGRIEVEVLFGNDRSWKNPVLIKEQTTAFVRAKEKDASKNLWVISRPHGASVFMDGDFVGYTSIEVFNTDKRNWSKEVIKNSSALKISGVTPGVHLIEIVGFPDFDYGPEQKAEFQYQVITDDVISVDIIRNKLLNSKNETILGKQRSNIFDF
ncbi:MAG: VWA domain-containing protein [Candidatus Marinimicrobia bacterium]|nr:VWA domain-containing protein [Candidatus Brocadiales bacterium]MBL7046581.1 VWA domain-containing protein [Candidatus Neomarinimicrobiota bacterium]